MGSCISKTAACCGTAAKGAIRETFGLHKDGGGNSNNISVTVYNNGSSPVGEPSSSNTEDTQSRTSLENSRENTGNRQVSEFPNVHSFDEDESSPEPRGNVVARNLENTAATASEPAVNHPIIEEVIDTPSVGYTEKTKFVRTASGTCLVDLERHYANGITDVEMKNSNMQVLLMNKFFDMMDTLSARSGHSSPISYISERETGEHSGDTSVINTNAPRITEVTTNSYNEPKVSEESDLTGDHWLDLCSELGI
mmetsp:Transcript_8362/g.19087  ORF Transcript_8362/g.19087 Transcript_8362/m.19087 type:complete len:253 (+) Transcript_8362:39-797(+)